MKEKERGGKCNAWQKVIEVGIEKKRNSERNRKEEIEQGIGRKRGKGRERIEREGQTDG